MEASLREKIGLLCSSVEHGAMPAHNIIHELGQDINAVFCELLSAPAFDLCYRLAKIVCKDDALSKLVFSSPNLTSLLRTALAALNDNNCRAASHELLCAMVKYTESISDEAVLTSIQCASKLLASDSAEYADSVTAITLDLAQKYAHLLRDIMTIYNTDLTSSPSVTVKLRYFAVLARLSGSSSAATAMSAELGVLTSIFSHCKDTSDPLSQMVAMDYLVDISATDEGLNFVVSEGMLRYLLLLCSGSENTSPDPMLSSHAAAVVTKILAQPSFTRLSWSHDTTLEIWNLLSALGRMIESGAELERLAGVDAIERFATSSPQAHILFLQNDAIMTALMELLRQKVEIQALVLHVVAKLFDVDISFPIVQASSTIMEPLSSEIAYLERKRHLLQLVADVKHTSAIEYCIKLIKSPITEPKYGAYEFLRALAADKSGWGFQLIINHPGLVEMLLDRTIEHTKEGKEWKFSVVSSLYENPKSQLLSEDIRNRMYSFLRMGPFYVPAAMSEMATMEK